MFGGILAASLRLAASVVLVTMCTTVVLVVCVSELIVKKKHNEFLLGSL